VRGTHRCKGEPQPLANHAPARAGDAQGCDDRRCAGDPRACACGGRTLAAVSPQPLPATRLRVRGTHRVLVEILHDAAHAPARAGDARIP